jgi:hypothetical protein
MHRILLHPKEKLNTSGLIQQHTSKFASPAHATLDHPRLLRVVLAPILPSPSSPALSFTTPTPHRKDHPLPRLLRTRRIPSQLLTRLRYLKRPSRRLRTPVFPCFAWLWPSMGYRALIRQGIIGSGLIRATGLGATEGFAPPAPGLCIFFGGGRFAVGKELGHDVRVICR